MDRRTKNVEIFKDFVFETIEYAVFCGGHETQNYDAFCEVLGAKEI